MAEAQVDQADLKCPKTSKSPLRGIGICYRAWFMWYWGSSAGFPA